MKNKFLCYFVYTHLVS